MSFPTSAPHFAIPGLMTPTSPKVQDQVFVSPDGSLELPIFTQDTSSSVVQVTFRIASPEFILIQKDEMGNYVTQSESGTTRTYSTNIPARTFPLGFSYLLVSINGKPHASIGVTRSTTALSAWKTSYCLEGTSTNNAGSIAPLP